MNLNDLLNQKDQYMPMTAGGYDLRSITKLAEEIANDVHMSAEYNLRELISYNGGTVHDITFEQFQQFKEKGVLDNSIYVNKTRDFDIVIHAYLPYYHTRYTLAHELGHYTLHADDKSYAKQKGNDQIEIEAHYFALGLLLPETLFYSGYKLSKDTDELSLILCVPPKLINTRKKLLNLK